MYQRAQQAPEPLWLPGPEGGTGIVAAMIGARDDVEAVAASRTGPQEHGGFRYRSWEDVQAAVRTVLTAHGIAVAMTTVHLDFSQKLVYLVNRYEFVAGDMSRCVVEVAAAGSSSTPYGLGSAHSYGWRYAMNLAFQVPFEDPRFDAESPEHAAAVRRAERRADDHADQDFWQSVGYEGPDEHADQRRQLIQRSRALPAGDPNLQDQLRRWAAQRVSSIASDGVTEIPLYRPPKKDRRGRVTSKGSFAAIVRRSCMEDWQRRLEDLETQAAQLDAGAEPFDPGPAEWPDTDTDTDTDDVEAGPGAEGDAPPPHDPAGAPSEEELRARAVVARAARADMIRAYVAALTEPVPSDELAKAFPTGSDDDDESALAIIEELIGSGWLTAQTVAGVEMVWKA